MNLDQATEAYIKLRDYKKKVQERHKKELEPVNEKMDKIEAAFLKYFQDKGAKSVKTAHGTPYLTERVSASVQDRDAFLRFVIQMDQLQFLESKANLTAVKEFIAEHEDTPPGVKVTTMQKVNIRS